jgi:2-(1,2-epoxy-1,2-dihydrophenyl)acetyl-CoA isomerase
MDKFETLKLTVDDGVAELTLNRPRSLNALNARMALDLHEAIAQLRADAQVRVLVLRGEGRAFCAGGDMRATAASGPRSAEAALQVMEPFQRLVTALHDFDRPIIAAAHGVVYGAGFSLLLLADIVLLADDARLCFAFQRVGLLPDCGALFTLPRAVGLQRAKALVFSGREIGAQEALEMGVALEVLPADALMARATALARAFCAASGTALGLAKRALNASLQSDLPTMLAIEASGQAVALSSSYVKEASESFAHGEAVRFQWPDRLSTSPTA